MEAFEQTVDSLKQVKEKIDEHDADSLENFSDFEAAILRSIEHMSRQIDGNQLLAEKEKNTLKKQLDQELSRQLVLILNNLALAYAQDRNTFREQAQVQWQLLSQQAEDIFHKLFSSVEKQITDSVEDFSGMTEAEFSALQEVIQQQDTLPLYNIRELPKLEDLATQSKPFPIPGSINLWRYSLNNQTIFIQETEGEHVFIFSAEKYPVSITAKHDELKDEIITEKLEEAIMDAEQSADEKDRAAANLRSALNRDLDELLLMESEFQASESERMAIDAAYNMGARATLHIKMQLLCAELLEQQGIAVPETFALDGSWGPSSQEAFNLALQNDSSDPNFHALIVKYRETFPNKPFSLFLTAEEINNPRYKFKNKGVFRATQSEKIKTRLIARKFDIHALQELNIDITEEVKQAYPKIMEVLNRLTDDAEMKASIIATMVLEKGISTWKDKVGVGRGDQKEAAYWLAKHMPKFTAKWNWIMPKRLGITSSGLMQINYRTGGEIIREYLGEYWPKEMIVDTLAENVTFSTVMAYLVYCENIQQIKKIKTEFYQSGSSEKNLYAAATR